MIAIILAFGFLFGSLLGYEAAKQPKPGEKVKLCPGESLAVSEDATFTAEKGIIMVTRDK